MEITAETILVKVAFLGEEAPDRGRENGSLRSCRGIHIFHVDICVEGVIDVKNPVAVGIGDNRVLTAVLLQECEIFPVEASAVEGEILVFLSP